MNCPLLSLCKCGTAGLCLYCKQLTICAVAVAFSLFLIFKPKQAIDIQIAFYRFINWKMEPISMDKEIRNTRIMGGLLLLCMVIAVSYTFFIK